MRAVNVREEIILLCGPLQVGVVELLRVARWRRVKHVDVAAVGLLSREKEMGFVLIKGSGEKSLGSKIVCFFPTLDYSNH